MRRELIRVLGRVLVLVRLQLLVLMRLQLLGPVRLLALGLTLGCGAVLAQAPAPPPAVASTAAVELVAADLQEEVQQIPVTVKDLYGREESKRIPLTIFKPAAAGPHPLVIFSHGRATTERRAHQGRQRFEHVARYLVSKGFVVVVPTRVGYGENYGDFDPEDAGGCSQMRIAPMAQAASDQVLAALAHARSLPYVDASRWVAMGVSVGGLTTLAVAARQPPGLVAAINFAGGAGGDPERRPGQPCLPGNIERLLAAQAALTPLPQLWLYWENDRYWGADLPKRWAQAWQKGGGALQFHMLPAVGADGHSGLGQDMNTWVPLVDSYLAAAGFAQPGVPARPPASSFAGIDEADKVPTSQANRNDLYRRFLAAKPPRAFAVGPNGVAGFASGDWALGRALGFCQARRGAPCKLYAVDDDVVWVP